MKLKPFILSLLSVITFGSAARAQVTSNQPSTFVNSSSSPLGHFIINANPAQQQNIFHSFSELNTTDGRFVNFVVGPEARNVISRITDTPTAINGLLTITSDGLNIAPNVNLFLLSPKGISFGPSTVTNIDGALVASTASGLTFADGTVFESDTAEPAMLTVSAPIGLQLSDSPAPIQVQGINQVSPTGGFNTLGRGQNVVLVGGDVNFEGGGVSLLGGRLQVAGLSEAGTVLLTDNSSVPGGFLSAALPVDRRRADVELVDEAQLLANGPVESIKVSARNLTIAGGRDASADGGSGSALLSGLVAGLSLPYQTGDINIDVTDSINLMYGNIYNGLDFGAVGDVGGINIEARSLYLTDAAQIGTVGRGQGNLGDLNINIHEDIVVNGQNSLVDRLTGFYSVVGDLFVQEGSGQAGDINVSARSLEVINGALVSASALGEGDAGDINIAVADRILLSGSNDLGGLASSISSSAEFTAVGDGGSVNIETSDLTIEQGAAIFGRTQGQGDAGDILLNVDALNVQSGGQIGTTSFTAGSAGDITLNANRIQLSGTDPTYDARVALTPFNTLGGAASGIYANTVDDGAFTSTGAGGNITIRTGDLSLSDTAQLSVSSQGTGAAGSLDIAADNQVRLSQGVIQAESRGGDQGNVAIASPVLLLSDRSKITTNATGTATGGNIMLNTPLIVGRGNSDIVARATQGSGGNINVNASGLFGISPRDALTPNSDINASSEIGVDGTVAITTPNIDPDSGLVELPANPTDSTNQLTAGCSEGQSRFIATGRGGLQVNPSLFAEGNRPWQDVRAIAALPASGLSSGVDLSQQPHTSPVTTQKEEQITEAAAWNRNSDDEIVLLSAAIPDLEQATCLSH